MNKGFWTRNWFTGISITILFLLVGYYSDIFQRLELLGYDIAIQQSHTGVVDDRIRIIAIDDHSLKALGHWPWPRNHFARLVDFLGNAQARSIVITTQLTEPRVDPGLATIRESLQLIQESSISTLDQDIRELDRNLRRTESKIGKNASKAYSELKAGFDKSGLKNRVVAQIKQLNIKLLQAEATLNSDNTLADSIQANGHVLLGMTVVPGEADDHSGETIPEYIQANTIRLRNDLTSDTARGLLPPSIASYIAPLPKFALAASEIGYLGVAADIDGAIRNDALVMRYADALFPSLSLIIAAQTRNIGVDGIQVQLGEPIVLGDIILNTRQSLMMLNHFYPAPAGQSTFQTDSFYDVLSGKIPLDHYKDKIVLVGETAPAITTLHTTPVSAAMAPVTLLAHQVSNILNNDFITRPEWAQLAEIAAIAVIAFYLILLLPLLRPPWDLLVTLLLGVLLLAGEYYLLNHRSEWVRFILPFTVLLIGYLALSANRFLVEERAKIQTAQEVAEHKRMLGLALQGQGKLELAFDKFREIPLDESLMETLYNLGLAFEHKRRYQEAHDVYEYMGILNTRYRDLPERMTHCRDREEDTKSGKNGSPDQGLLSLGGQGHDKPMLGRYVVEKELGKGAMGMVYQGKDPKISRTVAIKTMAWSKDLSDEELQSSKSRFFREAETAGSLNHPNIITIYDAGEEHDLAYIAMEFISGKNLMEFTRPLSLLPPVVALDLIARCSEALNYAHELNVVHRDIKPANIMYDPKSKSLKITDFGIARITNSSKTNTGMVLGTPSYMSPEQLAGEKVDGRSDLFSLGVMLFQLLTGRLPFQADTMATLMYKIANEEHLDITLIRPELPPCVAEIVNKMLQKAATDRYQSGRAIAKDIRDCIPKFSQASAS